jgi:Ca2+-binding EF-hand superfamily protein
MKMPRWLMVVLTFRSLVPMARLTILVLLIAFLLPAPPLWAKAEGILAVAKSTHTQPPASKIVRYAQRLISRYDADGSGSLTVNEWATLQGQPALIDHDQNGQITHAEMILHINEYARTRSLGRSSPSSYDHTAPSNQSAETLNQQDTTANKTGDSNIDPATQPANNHSQAPFYVPTKSRLGNLPGWFSQRDLNGDGQLSLNEFSPTHSSESVKTFQKLDANRDGLVTPQESVRPKQEPKQEKNSAGEDTP